MVLAMAFFSGAAGLIYEVLWAKQLALLVGGTALAQTIVLASFLGGLAAGSVWFGRRADAAAAPWRFYALVELSVAAAGAAAPLWLAGADWWGARWTAVPAVILPAFLMGGALPALCRAVGGEVQASVGRLYAFNSAGAAAGALATPFLVIPAVGLRGGFLAAAVLNACVAAAAVSLVKTGRPAARAAATPARGAEESMTAGLARFVVFASGFVALTYEVAWTRVLALVLGASAYSFAEMLAGLIAGLAIGGRLAASGWVRRREPGRMLALAQLGTGVSILLTLPAYGRLTFLFMLLRSAFSHGTAAFYGLEACKFGLCAGLMLAPAVCLGMSLPLAARLANPKDGEVGAGVGAVLAANTAGNVLGAFFGYWALPWLGLQGLFRSGTTVELVLGAALLWRASGGWDRRGWAAAAACAAVLVGWRAAMPRWDLRLMQQGFFRSRIVRPPHDFDEFRSHFKEITMPFYRDDREATVSVTTYPDVEAVLKVDGKTDASTGGDMRTQILLGELPLLLKPGARRAMLVGWGSGVTAGSILRHPVEALDAAELIPAVVDASEWFRAENGGALADRRLDLRVEDARTSLRRDGPAYDVIVSEPSNPWMAGVGNLFTREFYLQARRRLAPGGMMVQWFHLYEMNDEVFRAALRTYLSVFPHVTLWNVVDTDVLLVGSAEPLAPDFSAMERRFLSPAVWDDLRRAEFSTLTTLLALQSASEETVRAMAGEGPLNTDARPILEYEAPKAFFRADHVKAVIDADDRADPVPAQRLLLAKYLKARGRGLEPREYMDRVMFPHAFFEAKILRALIADWSRRYPKDPKAAVALYWLESVGKNKEAAERALRRTAALAREPRSAAAKSVIIGRP